MSVKVMAWVWARRDLSSTEKLILLALADHADDDGLCWPGQKGIAEKCGVHRVTTNKTLKNLEARGLIAGEVRFDTAGRTVGKSYRVKVPPPVADDYMSIPADNHRPVADDYTSKENHHREPSEENHQEETPSESSGADDKLEPSDLQQGWNDLCAALGLSKVENLSPTRLQKCRTRLREHPEVCWWERCFGEIRRSKFLLGYKNGNSGPHAHWKATFDWLIENDTNCVKTYEGQYGEEKVQRRNVS